MMRSVAIVILLALVCTALYPAPVVYPSAGDGTIAFRMLDVCHSSQGAIHQDLPFILECSCAPCSLGLVGLHVVLSDPSSPLLFASQDERPPKTLL